MIITLARQCGSGGTLIGRTLSKRYGLPLFDLRAITETGRAKGLLKRYPEFFAERPMNSLLSAITISEAPKDVRSSAKTILADLLPENDFILIGRCGNVVYGEREDCVRIFLCGEYEERVKVLMGRYGLTHDTAAKKVREADENRLAYQMYFTGTVWGQADMYDLSLNSCRLGFESTEAFIERYVDSVLA